MKKKLFLLSIDFLPLGFYFVKKKKQRQNPKWATHYFLPENERNRLSMAFTAHELNIKHPYLYF
jgi:hypothetical protein